MKVVLPWAAAAAIVISVAQPLTAWGQPRPSRPASEAGAGGERTVSRAVAIPAKGLFDGNQLSQNARARLSELVLEARGLDIDVALILPSGPWQTQGVRDHERRLSPERLDAVRRYLAERGVDPRRIFVESRIDPRLTEATLVVEFVGRPAATD